MKLSTFHFLLFDGGKKLKGPLMTNGKESVCQCKKCGLIPGLGRSPGEGNGNPIQYSCLKIPMDREAWRATVHGGHKESDVT